MSPGWLATVVPVATVALHVVVCVFALGVLPENRKPSTAMAWLILVLAVPFLGIAVFLLFGSTSVGAKRRAWQSDVNARVAEAVRGEGEADTPAGPAWSADTGVAVEPMARLNARLGALPMSHGNTVEVLPDYLDSIERMRLSIEQATDYVHVQFYISAWDDVTNAFFETLVATAARGVETRLLFDHLGSRGIPGYEQFLERLRASEILWSPMLPIAPLKGQLRRPDLRNHRKIVVVDGLVGFIGSQNLIEPGYDKPANHRRGLTWIETVARVTGPAVRQLAVVFATDWVAETGKQVAHTLRLPPADALPALGPGAVAEVACQVVPSGPGFATENNLRLFNSMLYGAKRRVSLTSPYFVPDETLLYAVTTAAQRGVEVELFVSEVADQFMVAHAQQSYYAALLEAGVRIWRYPEPVVLHSKFFTVDDDLAVIGSSNMDYRSFALNYECVMLVVSPGVVKQLRSVQDTYRSVSHELMLTDWQRRGWRSRYVDNVMRLTAALQ
jgi:cardiolipin synthase A/B